MNVAVNKLFLCLEFSQTTCLVLWITKKFETRNTKSLHNKQHIQVSLPTIPFTIYNNHSHLLSLHWMQFHQHSVQRGSLWETYAGVTNLSWECHLERTVLNSKNMEAYNFVAHPVGFQSYVISYLDKLNDFSCLSLLPGIITWKLYV